MTMVLDELTGAGSRPSPNSFDMMSLPVGDAGDVALTPNASNARLKWCAIGVRCVTRRDLTSATELYRSTFQFQK